MENANQIFSHLWAIYPSKSPLTVPNTLNKVILGSFGTRRPTTASFSHFYQLPKTSPPDIVDSLKELLLIPYTTLRHHRSEGLHFRLPRLSTKLDIKWKNLVLWIGRLSVPNAVDEVFRHGEDVNPLRVQIHVCSTINNPWYVGMYFPLV